jgi:hypothetical protein
MRLLRYRVTNFRSVVDSGWIEIEDITALIGENETGKTNLLLPLWKLNPVPGTLGSEINALRDMPVDKYTQMRHEKEITSFVRAEFEVDKEMAGVIAAKAICDPAYLGKVIVSRKYDGSYDVEFPNAVDVKVVPLTSYFEAQPLVLPEAHGEGPKAEAYQSILSWFQALKDEGTRLSSDDLSEALSVLHGYVQNIPLEAEKERIQKILSVAFDAAMKNAIPPNDVPEVKTLVVELMPRFIYYSNYGALDSRIHLPRVIEELKRPPQELSARDAGQARTLSVLFKHLDLTPKEILELGVEPAQPHADLNPDQIREILDRKEERRQLLSSAGLALSEGFREWWTLGNYTFSLISDGSYFNILVSDDRRPAEIALDQRSQGLQWFFSFFIVFLVERDKGHSNAILLLDEPGVTLHPLAQEALFRFFANLAQGNQLIYTAHSPFLVDPDHLSNVHVVYIDGETGETKTSSDLTKPEGDKNRTRAVYAVDAALGLSVSSTIMRYAQATIVEGTSDQTYLTIAKRILIGLGKIMPSRELVFLPSSGAAGVKAVAPILGVEGLPTVLLDSDAAGSQSRRSLAQGIYAGHEELLLMASDFAIVEEAETEDLMPSAWIVAGVDRLFRPVNDDRFQDVYDESKAIVPQIKRYCDERGVRIETPGWKVTLAREVEKRSLASGPGSLPSADEDIVSRWTRLFQRIIERDGNG